MQTDKFKVLLYLKKSGLDKSGQAPIMGRITYERTIACTLSNESAQLGPQLSLGF